ncbi:glycosyltransferase family 2 protein [Tenacibaculum aquimarinum]|uniref:glycosyltransferase family 2 protein n=1 Tax=Tenacibaculum aquimarinum TaxID=2910675 RepID=UPI001F0ACEF8|nr:glycosyltransferase [Tenacibaculum aquimarinum]MCH3884985.1 glycosyltransferase [Tenacibaculum aquimarinum]
MSITLIYPYRNRDIERIEKSLVSLNNQSNKNFKVLFVDYGSDFDLAKKAEKLINTFDFCEYIYSYHIHQPWSRPRAINIGVKIVETDYVFIADIDMIFRLDFIEKLQDLKDPNKSYFFKVGYLTEEETKIIKPFNEYSPKFYSNNEAQGLSLFPTQALKKVNSHDEYIHFWGADNDIHNRLINNGLTSVFYDKEVLMYHQWHVIYANEIKDVLAVKPQLPIITKINQQLQNSNKENKVTKVNLTEEWGLVIKKEEYELLKKNKKTIFISNREDDFLHFLYVSLPRVKEVIDVTFYEDPTRKTLKYKVKKMLKRKVYKYYSLKNINDILLLHLISFYKNSPYLYEVSDDLKRINLKLIKKIKTE